MAGWIRFPERKRETAGDRLNVMVNRPLPGAPYMYRWISVYAKSSAS